MRIFGSSETLPPTQAKRDTPAGVRDLRQSDLPAVLSIERRCFQTPWSLAMFVIESAKPGAICLATGAGRDLAGYLVCTPYADVWHLMNVAVDPGRRREGIASELVGEMLARTGPQARITLEVRTSNAAAIELYERFGFVHAGVRRRYYADSGEDALIMWRDPTGKFEL